MQLNNTDFCRPKNHIQSFRELNNKYYGMRHGFAENNELGKIISNPETCRLKFGLVKSEIGKLRERIRRALEGGLPTDNLLIISGSAKRHVESAEIVADESGLDTEDIMIDNRLNERFFGGFEGQNSGHYERVWHLDAINAFQNHGGIESVNDVLSRSTSLVAASNGEFHGKHILLVSSGDPLQILDTGFTNIPAERHRSVKHWQNGEIRPFVLAK